MTVGKRQRVNITDHTANVQSFRLCVVSTDFLHSRTAINRMHLKTVVSLEQGDPNRVGSSAHIEYALAGVHVHGRDKPGAEKSPQPEASNVVRLIIILSEDNVIQEKRRPKPPFAWVL
jgi:hypothetical protein